MSARMRVFALAAAVVCAALAVFSQARLDAARATAKDDLLYLPNEKLLNHFTGGMASIISDLLWIRCVQYTADELKGEHSFTWLNHMLNTCVRLDPYFVDVYRYGGIFLASLRADDDAGLDLLARGVIENPGAYELPYEMGMIYLLNRKDEPGSREKARHYFGMSARTGAAPAFVAELVTRLGQDSAGDLAIEREMWTKLSESGDTLLRDMARGKLEELALREYCTALTKEAAALARRTGQVPGAMEDLLRAGIITALPQDPFGGSFFIDRDGVVRSTTILDNEMLRRKTAIENALSNYHEKQGKWPARLDEIVGPGYLQYVPAHPYPDRAWQYDPASGRLE